MGRPRENSRLEKIKKENAKFEKESPYNFCDRWCERCDLERQKCCRLYLDELEQKLTCIAHGREQDDPEITAEVMKHQYEDVEKFIEEYAEENEIDFEDIDDGALELIRRQEEFIQNNPLHKTAQQYLNKTHEFLKDAFYKKKEVKPELTYDFETVAWYHTLMPVKLYRALCGFHEPVSEDEFALYDAVAQFEICKKAITKSVKALRKIKRHFPSYHVQILELLALLHNIHSRIETLEESI